MLEFHSGFQMESRNFFPAGLFCRAFNLFLCTVLIALFFVPGSNAAQKNMAR